MTEKEFREKNKHKQNVNGLWKYELIRRKENEKKRKKEKAKKDKERNQEIKKKQKYETFIKNQLEENEETVIQQSNDKQNYW